METMGGSTMFTARDFARLGELFRHDGAWRGRRIVPADYVRQATTVLAPHLAKARLGPMTLGYGYYWWLPEPGASFSAIGHFDQFIYVHPARRTTIVKLSANLHPGENDRIETLALFNTIAEAAG